MEKEVPFNNGLAFIKNRLNSFLSQDIVEFFLNEYENKELTRFISFLNLIHESLKILLIKNEWENGNTELRFEAKNFATEWSVLELTNSVIHETLHFKIPIIKSLERLQGEKYRINYANRDYYDSNTDFELKLTLTFGKIKDNYFPVNLQHKFKSVPESAAERQKLSFFIIHKIVSGIEKIKLFLKLYIAVRKPLSTLPVIRLY